MYHHVKKLMYTVRVDTPDPKFGNMLLEQIGGANGELAAAMQYSIQGLNCEDPERKDLLMDIGTEELSHLEIVGALARLHLKPLKFDREHAETDPLIAIAGGGGVNLFNSQGNPWTADYLKITGELDVDLRSNIAAEARAKIVYERLINFTTDAGTKDALQFLMTREITHMKAFTAALESMKKPRFMIGRIPPTPGLVDQFFNTSTGHGEDGELDARGPWNEGEDLQLVEAPAFQALSRTCEAGPGEPALGDRTTSTAGEPEMPTRAPAARASDAQRRNFVRCVESTSRSNDHDPRLRASGEGSTSEGQAEGGVRGSAERDRGTGERRTWGSKEGFTRVRREKGRLVEDWWLRLPAATRANTLHNRFSLRSQAARPGCTGEHAPRASWAGSCVIPASRRKNRTVCETKFRIELRFKGSILRCLFYALPLQLSRLARRKKPTTSRLTAAALDGGRSNIGANRESVARPPQVSRKPLVTINAAVATNYLHKLL